MDWQTVNWNDPQAHVSAHFTVFEATHLPSWSVCHIPSDAEKQAIVAFAARLDLVRDMLGKPMRIHVWIRPAVLNCPTFDPTTIRPDTDAKRRALATLNYNAYVGGATHSAHVLGRGADWDDGDDCDAVRERFVPQLEMLGLRMEDKPKSGWVHNDDMPPNPNRFFPV